MSVLTLAVVAVAYHLIGVCWILNITLRAEGMPIDPWQIACVSLLWPIICPFCEFVLRYQRR